MSFGQITGQKSICRRVSLSLAGHAKGEMAIRWEMFWIVLYLIGFSIILYRSLLFSSLHAFAVFTVIYIAFYLVAYSGDGSRSWHWLRSFTLWDVLRPYQVYCASFEEFRQDQKYLFIVLYTPETATHSRLHMEWRMSIWAFSFYGKKLPFFSSARPIVCLPDRVFKVPYLTEVLQWLGCISIRHAQDAWECPNTSIILPAGQGELFIERDAKDLWMAIVRHDPEARCTIIGEPFLYQHGEMDARIEAVSRMMPINPYSYDEL